MYLYVRRQDNTENGKGEGAGNCIGLNQELFFNGIDNSCFSLN